MPLFTSAFLPLNGSSTLAHLDATHLSDVCQALAREIELEKLLATLLHSLSETFGANKCAVLMWHENRWDIAAIAERQQMTIGFTSLSVEPSQAVPMSLVQGVARSSQPILLSSAIAQKAVATDPYFRHPLPQSALCTPILNQGELMAIVYLEQDQSSKAFTGNRAAGLNLLLTHSAIALNNALRYQTLQHSVAIAQAENLGLKTALAATQEQMKQVVFRAEIDCALTNGSTLQDILKHCTDAMVQHLGAAFARIWTLNADENVLELQVSSGLYTHIDGDHGRVPVGMFKIGWIAQERQPHLTNSVLDDPRVGNKEWARQMGMVAFAGYPLLVEGRLVGVIAMFAYQKLTESVLEVLKLAATEVALGIVRKQTEEALYRSEARLRQQTQELQQALQEVQRAQAQMVQSEKMSALGSLVAGVAHEINNPVGFLAGNINPALQHVEDLFGLVDLYQRKYSDAEIETQIETIELGYLRQDLPKLIGSMREGVERIRGISASLRTFSRADCDRSTLYNLHDGIDGTLLILKHRLKGTSACPAIEVIKSFGRLPLVECFAGQMNQVFMNLLANAIDALEEANVGRSLDPIVSHPNQITIRSAIADDGQQIVIGIRDNGLGMSDAVKGKVFEHLFTTKAVGKGTGLGLAIARSIVVEKHAGTLDVCSELGQGTEFVITLPIRAATGEDKAD
ncbi:GAF domain-containing protein [Myxacorys almedinensis]|uniref:histidine kinase n=1 Tax=Myxacorys almedinensis A TaxID=2690445 RepID=A0A8J7Z139_9CYAN|nr:GAF domain-containing protein [Myxacorys almedinensis]NDJ18157.1 GAF domain-containing protein [Myxacorys almedinensis A]